MKILVTGGAGFIGSSIVRRLVARGDRVTVLDDFSTGSRENLNDVTSDIELIPGDIRDARTCERACKGAEAVLHQAALGSVPRSIEDPYTTHTVNVDGTVNMLLAARDAGVERFVFASSSSVYGNAPEREKVESLLARPLSPYAVSKLAAEAYTCVFHRSYGLRTVALRYFNVFGPRQSPAGAYAAVFPRFAIALLSATPPTVYGDGQQSRDFTYVQNVVDCNLLALECGDESCGRAYNVGCHRTTSVNDLFRLMRDAVGGPAREIEPIHAPPRDGDVRDSLASIEAARRGLGFEPEVDVEEGIRRTVEWYRACDWAKALQGG